MRGDFLGGVSLAWEDLEIGRELDLTLVSRKGVQGGSKKGTIQLLVGEPMTEVVEEQGLAFDAVAASNISKQSASDVTVKKEEVRTV